jgi:hypothetical protein
MAREPMSVFEIDGRIATARLPHVHARLPVIEEHANFTLFSPTVNVCTSLRSMGHPEHMTFA